MNARKRRRAGEASLAEIYRDPIPLPDTFTTIWSSEGTMGGRLYYATVLSAGAWDDETSWAPQDDNTYALMPDGVGYDLAVEGDFMNNEDEEEMADGTESGNQGSGPQSTPTVTVNNNNNTTASRNKAKRSLVSIVLLEKKKYQAKQSTDVGSACRPILRVVNVALDDTGLIYSIESKFLYTVMICLDANFRLKNQMVSNYSQDPGLGLGLAYMIHRTKYEEYVKSRANEKDISTCVGFQALAKANSKFSKGLRYTGVGMGVCGRSEMILGVGNLHKGERYANMDYIFGTILKALSVISILASYDIACQWFLNLLKRMQEDWPPEIKPSSDMQFTPAIPKLHASMHKQSHANHDVFSLNLIPGAGQSDGECPERVWGPHNAVGNATKTMGPGSRQDTLDDHFGFWNWLKYTSMGTTLLKRYRRAVAD
ncbi:hypothetical protein JR316_0012060 [Psilocybe cubensis]|uniref:Uncharacterized protein n=1 Tax=Psilocybe cubensis TaxID=181762 RepID=A0ACB8GHG9_PSICU|nr:hypothetical protein JR316_0012060 [Psilocybe cubensis]KAH9474961.1 hypothetical protein JR316_0012060 [Psilocybe cubensis]